MGDNRPTSFSQYSRRREYDIKEDIIFDYAGTHHCRILKLFHSPNPHVKDSIGDRLITPEYNRIFHLRFYLPKPALTSKEPEIREVMIMFNGLNETERFDLYDVLGQHFAEQGMAAVLLPTPYHLNRFPPQKTNHAGHPSPHKMLFRNPMLLFHNYKQSMIESDLLIKKLCNHNPDDEDFRFYQSLFVPNLRISTLGFSLGGLRALANFLHAPETYHTCIIFNSGVELRLLDTSFLKIGKKVWNKFVSKLEDERTVELTNDDYWRHFSKVYLGNSRVSYIEELFKLSHRMLFILSGGDQIVPADHLKDIEEAGHGLTSLKIAGVGHIPTTDPKWTYWMDRVAEFIIRFDRAKQNVWSGQEIITEVASLIAGTPYRANLSKSDGDFSSADLRQLLENISSDQHEKLLKLFYASIAYYPNFREVLNGVLKLETKPASKRQAAGTD